MAARNNLILIGGAVIYKESRGKRYYWLVQDAEGRWEIPKVTVRRGESSPRATLRMTGEQAGMNGRILEEVARASTMVVVNGKAVNQKTLYYLLILKSAGEVLGFAKHQWLEAKRAERALPLKKEKEAIREGEALLKKWAKEKKSPQ